MTECNSKNRPEMPGLLSEDPINLRSVIQQRYTLVAERGLQVIPDDGGACCGPADEVCCSPNAERLYSADEIASVTDAAAAAAAGCGMVFLTDGSDIGHLPVTRHHQSAHRSLMEALEMIRSRYDEGEHP